MQWREGSYWTGYADATTWPIEYGLSLAVFESTGGQLAASPPAGIRHLVRDDQMMPRIYGYLHVVLDHA
jgi:hypothetical protein